MAAIYIHCKHWLQVSFDWNTFLVHSGPLWLGILVRFMLSLREWPWTCLIHMSRLISTCLVQMGYQLTFEIPLCGSYHIGFYHNPVIGCAWGIFPSLENLTVKNQVTEYHLPLKWRKHMWSRLYWSLHSPNMSVIILISGVTCTVWHGIYSKQLCFIANNLGHEWNSCLT